MANDEINVRFGGDLGPLGTALRGMRGMVEKAGESMKESFKEVWRNFSAPLSIAGAFEAIHSLMEDVKNIKRISESTGLDTGVTQDLLNLGKAAGIAGDAIESAMDKFVKGLAAGSDPTEELYKIADRLAAVGDPAERARIATDAFGRSGVKLIPILMEGSEGVKRLAAEWGKLDEVQMDLLEHSNQTLEKAVSKGKILLAEWLEGIKDTAEQFENMPWWQKIFAGPLALPEAIRQARNSSPEGPDSKTTAPQKTPAEIQRARVDAALAAAKELNDAENGLFSKPQDKLKTLDSKIVELKENLGLVNSDKERKSIIEEILNLDKERMGIAEKIATNEKEADRRRQESADKQRDFYKQILGDYLKIAELESQSAPGALNRQYGTLQEVANSGYSYFRGNMWRFQEGPLAEEAQRAMFLDARAHRERIFGNKSGAESDEALSQNLKQDLENQGAIAPTITEHLAAMRTDIKRSADHIVELNSKIAELKKSTE